MQWAWEAVRPWPRVYHWEVCEKSNTSIFNVVNPRFSSLDNLLFAEGIRRISRSFMDFNCRNIQSIDLSRCHMANPGLRFFCEALNGSPLINLRYLRIHWNSITAGGIRHLALTISLGILDSLEVLDLSSRNESHLSHRKPNRREGHDASRRKHSSRQSPHTIARPHRSLYPSSSYSDQACRLKAKGMRPLGVVIKQLKELRVLSVGSEPFLSSSL